MINFRDSRNNKVIVEKFYSLCKKYNIDVPWACAIQSYVDPLLFVMTVHRSLEDKTVTARLEIESETSVYKFITNNLQKEEGKLLLFKSI